MHSGDLETHRAILWKAIVHQYLREVHKVCEKKKLTVLNSKGDSRELGGLSKSHALSFLNVSSELSREQSLSMHLLAGK